MKAIFCILICSALVTYQVIATSINCSMTDGRQSCTVNGEVIKCGLQDDSKSCSAANKYCLWQTNKCGGGLVNCSTITDQTICEANDCVFNDAKCATVADKKPKACESLSLATFDDTACKNSGCTMGLCGYNISINESGQILSYTVGILSSLMFLLNL